MTPRKPADTIPISDVTIDDEFWSPRMDTNRETTIEYQYEQLEQSGTLENFRRTRDGKEGGFSGMWFQDSDAYKWIEAASYVLASRDDPALEENVDEVISLIAAAQDDNGYINTYFSLVEPENRWTNLHMMHELYCVGHLIEAAVAHYRATGKRSLLDVAIDAADHVDDVFDDEIHGVPGHEEIELGLLRLYRVTEEQRYLDLAKYFIDLRGHDDRLEWELSHPQEIGGYEFNDGELIPDEDTGSLFLDDEENYDGRYAQAHAPLREQEKVEGHSVRAMYLFAAAADLAIETGEDTLVEALERLWDNMTTKRMYITGGIGPEHEHEGFTEDYDLPNETAYAETCAAIGSIYWNQRMFELSGASKYADLIERTLYNGFLSGVSLDGTRFFYVNPLASSGDHHRKGWFTCACCPPNAARLLASLNKYIYGQRGEELYVNQYIGSTVETTVGDRSVQLTQSSSLPWEGSVSIDVDADGELPINLRIPEWADGVTVTLNGETVTEDADEYLTIERDWEEDSLELTFDQEVERMRAHPAVESDAGRMAVTRGPLVYCAEDVDQSRQVHQFSLSSNADVEVTHREDLFGGITTIETDAVVPDLDEWEDALYRPDREYERESERLTLVPYYAWDNREPGQMRVWLRANN